MFVSLISNPHVTVPGRPHELGNVVRHVTHVSRPSNNRHEPLQPPQQLPSRATRVNSSFFNYKRSQQLNDGDPRLQTSQPPSPSSTASHQPEDTLQIVLERRHLHELLRRRQAAAALLLLKGFSRFHTFFQPSNIFNDSVTLWATAQAPTLRHFTHPRRRHRRHILVDVLLDDDPLQLPFNAAAVPSASTHH